MAWNILLSVRYNFKEEGGFSWETWFFEKRKGLARQNTCSSLQLLASQSRFLVNSSCKVVREFCFYKLSQVLSSLFWGWLTSYVELQYQNCLQNHMIHRSKYGCLQHQFTRRCFPVSYLRHYQFQNKPRECSLRQLIPNKEIGSTSFVQVVPE